MFTHDGPFNRRLSRPRASLTGLLALICVVALPPTTAAAWQPAVPFRDAGTLTIVTSGAAADLDPANDSVAASDMLVRNMYETLIALDGGSIDRYTPALATSWSVNADKSVYVFHLRHGVRFHTGRCCLTAADVQYSLLRLVASNLNESYVLARFLTKPQQQIKVVDPFTVAFDLGRPQPSFLGGVASVYAPYILDAQALKAHRSKSDPWAHAYATDHDLGTGPYMLRSWAHSQQEVLVRFPGYWGGWSGPHFSTVIVRTILADTTRRELLERGQADLTFQLTPQDDDALKANPAVRVVAPYGTEIEYIVMTEAGPLASPYARQALSYAFGYDAMIHGIDHGYARRAYGPLASDMLGYDPQMFHYNTDLVKAKALLRKAGVKPGTTLTYVYADPFGPAGLVLQAQLAQLGITVKLQHLDEAVFSSIFYGSEPASKRPNLMPWGWWPDYNDPYDECVPLVASYSTNAGNAGYYHNKAVDALLADMQNADRARLIRDAVQLQAITSRVDPSDIWVDEPAQVTVMGAHLHGVVFNPLAVQTYDFYPMYRA